MLSLKGFIKAPTGCGMIPGSVELQESSRRVKTKHNQWPTARKKLCAGCFLTHHEVQNKLQASSSHLIQIKRVRPLLGSNVGRALHGTTGPNDKRNFCRIIPLSYCGLVMPNFSSVLFRGLWARHQRTERERNEVHIRLAE